MKPLVLASLLIFAGCSRPEISSVEAVQEAVFRYQFENNASLQQKSASVFFLAFGIPGYGQSAIDPPDSLMVRFKGSRPRVAGYSQASKAEDDTFIDKTTHERGILFFVHGARIIDGHTAEAKGGYREAALSGAENVYRLKLTGSGWSVVAVTNVSISQKMPNPSAQPTRGLGLRFRTARFRPRRPCHSEKRLVRLSARG